MSGLIELSSGGRSSTGLRPTPRRLLLPVALWALLIGAGLLVAWAGSWRAVDGIHAIELGDGQFIHGSNLDCEQVDGHDDCSLVVDGKLFTTRTASQDLGPDLWSCEATFAGRSVDCDPSHVTSSYWPRGVTIADAELAAAAEADGSTTGGWRTLFLGRSEEFVMRAGFAFAAVVSLLAVVVGLGLNWSDLRRRSTGVLVGAVAFVPLLAVAAVVVPFAILTFGYAD